MTTHQYTPLLRLAFKSMKYFLWMLFGLAIAYALSSGLGIANMLPALIYLLQNLLVPLGLILLCLITTAVIVESWR
ncbi:hypothetical protein [Fortiea contorta]|uniref:hypothetical protein n=1 Tax=Fortiea contorta TaxID=1892405 RepID=UPI00036DD473|nr:hypothetical protein [Fortiea contorta]